MKTMGLHITTIVYLRIVIQVGSTILKGAELWGRGPQHGTFAF